MNRGLRSELPFLLGCGLACALLARPGVVFFGHACGSDWPSYLENAARFWHPDWPGLVYQDWRKPLHAFLIGLLGEWRGYLVGAQWITLGSTLATVLGAGLLGRALGGRTTGVLSALVVALLPALEQSGRWVNLYPLLAGLGALALGLAAACLRWPRLELALSAGLMGGLAWACDFRGGVPLILTLLTVVASAVAARRRGWWALALVLVALVGAAAGWGLDQGLQRNLGIDPLSLQRQVAVQSEVSIGPNLPPEVRQLCAPDRLESAHGVRLGADCTRVLLPHNWAELVSFDALPPTWWLALFLPALLPARWGRRSSIGVALLLGGSVAAMLVGMALVAYPERYALLQLVPLALVLPVGFERLVARLVPAGGGRGWGGLVQLVAVLAVVCVLWPRVWPMGREPAQFCRAGGIPVPGLERGRQAVLSWAQSGLGPTDVLLDCSLSSFDELLLPQRLPLREVLPGGDACSRWVRTPPVVRGTVWLVTLAKHPGLPEPVRQSDAELRDLGWTAAPLPGLQDPGPLHLWRR